MTLQEAQEKAETLFGEDAVAMIGRQSYVGKWEDPDKGCGGNYLCLGSGATFEEAFDAVGKHAPVLNPA